MYCCFCIVGFVSADFINVRQTVEQLSITNSWEIWNNYSSPGFQVSSFVTSDNRYIVFTSDATNLVSWDTNWFWDVFLRDRQFNTLELVSITLTWLQGNGASSFQMLSDDGRYVVFQSNATNFFSWDTNNAPDIFVKDRQTWVLEIISINSSGNVWNAISRYPWITPDGRYVLFESSGTNLVPWATDWRSHVYLRDRQNNTLELINRTNSWAIDNHTTTNIRWFSMTPDGRYVVFHSNATNIVSWTSASFTQIYLRDRQLWTSTLLSRNNSWVIWNGISSSPIISRDGRYVVFYGRSANFFTWASAAIYQTYVRDIQAWITELISNSLTGGFGNWNSNQAAHISSGGRYVLFYSLSDNLVTWDTNGVSDLFLKDRLLSTIQRVSVTYTWWELNSWSSIAQVSNDGKYVFYGSDASNVFPSDTNNIRDVFTAEYKTIYLDPPTIITPSSWSLLPVSNILISWTWYSGYQIYITWSAGFVRSWMVNGSGLWSTTIPFLWWDDYILDITQTYLTWSYTSWSSSVSFTTYLPSPTIQYPISGSILSGSIIISWTWTIWSTISLSYTWVLLTGIVDGSWYWNISLPSVSDGVYILTLMQEFSWTLSLPVFLPFTIDSTIPLSPSIWWWGWWWNSLTKDNCPDWDYTNSYYDNSCGKKPTIDTWVVIDDNDNIDTPILYPASQIYNDTITNGYCYTKKSTISIVDSSSIITNSEFKKALTFLYSYDMTIFNHIDQFDPYRTLTREEAAKIFSNFAMNVLCRKPDKNLTIEYADIENSDTTLKPYITLAYQLWLMKWWENQIFRPKDTITKSELNAVLIRMILKSYLSENTTDIWYDKYNTVSSDLGIIKYGAGNEAVMRNDASLMLFRAYKNQLFSLQNIDYESFVLQNRDQFIQ